MKWLRSPRLFLLIGGVGLLVLAAAVSTGPAGVIWLLVGLTGFALISFMAPRFRDAVKPQPDEEELAGAVDVEPAPVEVEAAPVEVESVPVEVEPAPVKVEPAPDSGEFTANVPAPGSDSSEETGTKGKARHWRRKNRPRFLPTRIRLPHRQKDAAETASANGIHPHASGRRIEDIVVAEAITYQRGRPPVVQRVRLRFRGVSVQLQTAPPSGV
ncbi:MAG TPA: hypothetical protein VIL07_04720 [Symbiobacteriaceae bacterium]